MAEQQTVTFSDKPVGAKQKEKDFEEHERTFALFMSMSKWGTILVAILLIVLYLLLV
ncbi:aa3-type cytochrome c oxidase subunit IV [Pelagibacterium montanilacus]|uniref:aa3-type cytochrome c oxidase subunit IV n=1 Tax=Pelagibacterium montanilacus TaxID=2185280 RepID=UPI000F8F3456|nr:aa3-type cytochrome c oxidase subunit IV [Pelagibacterium montanilacus]